MSDVVLFWGVTLQDPPDWGEDWGLFALERMGMNVPQGPLSVIVPRARRLLAEETGCTLGTYGILGPGRPPTWFLGIAESVLRVPQGQARPVEVTEVGAGWRDAVLELCEELGLAHSPPGWGLAVELEG